MWTTSSPPCGTSSRITVYEPAVTRRAIDIIVALIALLLASPVLLAAGLAVVVGSRGRPFYRSPRVGRDGRPFLLWKLRTMRPAAASYAPQVTAAADPRITRIGRVLRRTKVDELPGFLNLLAGDITLVGPRPESPVFVARYSPAQREVLRVRPGLTGPNQLHLADEEALIPAGVDASEFYVEHILPAKVEADLAYLRTRTPVTDAYIVLRTTRLVIGRLVGLVVRRR